MSETLNICEIFGSIQGESTMAGSPCAFVRLAGCNLRCGYCDSRYADHGRPMGMDAIVEAVESLGMGLIELTGGEPLMQEGAYVLMDRLLGKGYRLMIETNGSYPIDRIDPRVMIVMDVKTPGSNQGSSVHLDNLQHLKPADNLKFVLTDEKDYLWARRLIYEFDLHKRCTVLLSASFGRLDYKALADWMIRDRIPARMNIQIHKHIWSPHATGV